MSRTTEEIKRPEQRQGNNNDIREVIVYLDKDWGTPSSTARGGGNEAELVTKRVQKRNRVALSVGGKGGAMANAAVGSFELSDEEEEAEESKERKGSR